MNFVELTENRISVGDVMDLVAAPNCGAVSFFVGTTRNNFEEKKVVSLEYEAYDSMAVKAMNKICEEIRDKWKSVENIAIYHRLGNVPVKEASVVIAVSSPHRTDSMQATEYCINTLKKSVPIWKKELYEDSKSEWKANPECPWTPNKVEIEQKTESCHVPSHLIQINCSQEEINRRIQTFMNRKREHNDLTNIQDFCGSKKDEEGCARVNSKFRRVKDAKSHLRMHKVSNTQGPLAKLDYISSGVQERLETVEKQLNIIKPVTPNIYERLKQMEDRLLYLESISPEYSNFWNKNVHPSDNVLKPSTSSNSNKLKYNVDDIDRFLWELEEKGVLM